MSREQVRFVIALVTITLLGVIAYYVTAAMREQAESENDLLPLTRDVVPEVAQRMQNFRRAKIRDGKKVWEIAASQARYDDEKGEIVVEGPEVTLYLKDGEMIALRCREGRVFVEGGEQEVKRMELNGDLEMHIGDLSLKTPSAVYESEQNIISSSALVQITGRGLSVEGQGYTVDVDEKRLTLNADVHTLITRDNS